MVKNTFFDSRKCCPLCYSQKVKIIFSKKFDDIKTKEFFKTHLNTKFPMRILNNRFYEISECEKCHFIFLILSNMALQARVGTNFTIN